MKNIAAAIIIAAGLIVGAWIHGAMSQQEPALAKPILVRDWQVTLTPNEETTVSAESFQGVIYELVDTENSIILSPVNNDVEVMRVIPKATMDIFSAKRVSSSE